jgi:hypothetical protein
MFHRESCARLRVSVFLAYRLEHAREPNGTRARLKVTVEKRMDLCPICHDGFGSGSYEY